METENKQWVCHPVPAADKHGQLGPEDLSSNSKTGAVVARPTVKAKITVTSATSTDQLVSEIHSKNGLDHRFVQHVEDAVCENSRQTILRILEEVTRLSSVEKLLLYLKLPTDLNNVSDPLRQPLNPLGSRTEISQTIMWIRTHLEEEPELSLPKQEVYNEYTLYCANNNMKPLSTADFGKVMKQVYPSVRPRRLGTRGNSRYCYAGLHKRFKLEAPQLPDLCDRPQSTEAACSAGELASAAWTVVREWAETVLGVPFHNVRALAKYLVKNVQVGASPAAASLVCGAPDEPLPALKHKEAQFQLQRKLQQREVLRDHKRKLQQLQAPRPDLKARCKKSRLQPAAPEPEQPAPVCDRAEPAAPGGPPARPDDAPPDGDASTDGEARVAPKLPIPRLPGHKLKLNVVPVRSLMPTRRCQRSPKYKAIQPKPGPACAAPAPAAGPPATGPPAAPSAAEYMTRERLISISNVDKDALDDYLHGGNNSQEQEEELLQYFNNAEGTEAAGPAPPGAAEEQTERTEQAAARSKCDKLSQLRLLLEQNLSGEVQGRAAARPGERVAGAPPPASRRRVSFEVSGSEADPVPPSPNTRRKNFSFTPISPGPVSPGGRQSKCSSTSASPFVSPRNTPVPRAKGAAHAPPGSFLATATGRKPPKPLRPVKHEAEVAEPEYLGPSAMSAPASPMMPYGRPRPGPNLLQKLLDSSAKVPYVPDYDKAASAMDQLSQEVSQLLGDGGACFEPTYRSQSVPLHQMAPFKAQASPCALAAPQPHFNFGFPAATAAAAPAEYPDFEPFSVPDALLNNGLMADNINESLNENITQILNILDAPAPLDEADALPAGAPSTLFPFEAAPLDTGLFLPHGPHSAPKLGRSHSTDVDVDLRTMCQHKFEGPSRSVPSTPLPYSKLDPLGLNNNNADAPFPADELSIAFFNQDFLLNGQPVKEKFAVDFGDGDSACDNKPGRLALSREPRLGADAGFGARRNLNPLLEQQYADAEEFTAVPSNAHT